MCCIFYVNQGLNCSPAMFQWSSSMFYIIYNRFQILESSPGFFQTVLHWLEVGSSQNCIWRFNSNQTSDSCLWSTRLNQVNIGLRLNQTSSVHEDYITRSLTKTAFSYIDPKGLFGIQNWFWYTKLTEFSIFSIFDAVVCPCHLRLEF